MAQLQEEEQERPSSCLFIFPFENGDFFGDERMEDGGGGRRKSVSNILLSPSRSVTEPKLH